MNLIIKSTTWPSPKSNLNCQHKALCPRAKWRPLPRVWVKGKILWPRGKQSSRRVKILRTNPTIKVLISMAMAITPTNLPKWIQKEIFNKMMSVLCVLWINLAHMELILNSFHLGKKLLRRMLNKLKRLLSKNLKVRLKSNKLKITKKQLPRKLSAKFNQIQSLQNKSNRIQFQERVLNK